MHKLNLKNTFSNSIWLMIIILPGLLPGINPDFHYASALIISIFIFTFYSSDKHMIACTICFFAYICTFLILGSDISSLKYIIILILTTQLRHIPIDIISKGVFIFIFINFLWVLLELSIPYGAFRMIFRSSLQEFHIHRSSGLFGFPGDLGHFAVSFFTYFFVYRPTIKFSSFHCLNKKWLMPWVIACALCFILLLTSQSRLALIQFSISMILISIKQSLLSIFLLVFLGVFVSVYFIDLEYLFTTDWLAIFHSLRSIDNTSEFKRVADLSLLFSNEIVFLPSSLPNEVEFVESGFVSQIFRMGVLIVIPTITIIIFTGIYAYLYAGKNKLLLSVSIVSLSMLATNFVGAPFERPKLMFYNLIFVSLLFHLVYNLRGKSDSKRKKSL